MIREEGGDLVQPMVDCSVVVSKVFQSPQNVVSTPGADESPPLMRGMLLRSRYTRSGA